MTSLAPTLQAFFTDRLQAQRHASGRTITAYRDSLRLLIGYVCSQTGKQPSRLDFDDLDGPMIGSFLTHLEQERHNTVRTRNARLAAVHSLFRYAALRHPEHAATIQRVLEIPPKRFDQPMVCYLTKVEAEALLGGPNLDTWLGRRDHALLALAIQTGLRVAEITGLHTTDVSLTHGPHVRVLGKGRKERCIPLTATTTKTLATWLRERSGPAGAPVFPSRRGTPLSTDPVEALVAKHTNTAAGDCPSLIGKTPSTWPAGSALPGSRGWDSRKSPHSPYRRPPVPCESASSTCRVLRYGTASFPGTTPLARSAPGRRVSRPRWWTSALARLRRSMSAARSCSSTSRSTCRCGRCCPSACTSTTPDGGCCAGTCSARATPMSPR